ncbi:DUF4274 domain-containing protein [Vibrio sp. SCSIO 43132]|uniref:DUF4274 domain-containing protein n=1 Tax=Vibrio sp. SCSIO 43132 TaxID=2779363 RepID=UPI001CA8D228|nr:DUF4274 domain-containing protein [Vibrio sp. SCSIO 43132]UAB73211.1 DUF4274 domain-containing protein [Vibrio sp. SCSIO 43132]
MAKRLSKEEKYRASVCFECGCIPTKKKLEEILIEKGEELEILKYVTDQFGIEVGEAITVEGLASKEEIHYAAANYNWDDGNFDVLNAFLDHPKCDAGTANMLYWKGSGFHAAKFSSSSQEKHFYEKLLSKFKERGFATYQIAFDPYDELFVPSLDECLEQGYEIPGYLFCQYSTMKVDTD